MKKQKGIRTIIAVLAALLAVSLLMIFGIYLRARLDRGADMAEITDNFIGSVTEDESSGAGGVIALGKASKTTKLGVSNINFSIPATSKTAGAPLSGASSSSSVSIELYNRQSEDNTPFNVTNMFPGDNETKYYCVRVSYHDSVTVHFRATVRPGYEKLAEVLKIKVVLLNTGETMYDGLMKNMPASVTHKLRSSGNAVDELDYEITAYLDTSVGNEYQEKDLIADFKWWVEGEEKSNLNPMPATGDASALPWACLAIGAGLVVLLIIHVRNRRKGRKEYE